MQFNDALRANSKSIRVRGFLRSQCMSSNPLITAALARKSMPPAGAEPASREAYANGLKYMRDYIIMLGRPLMRALAAPSSSSYNSAVALAEEHAPSLPTHVVGGIKA